MIKLVTTMIFSAFLVTSANPLQTQSPIVDGQGQLILLKAEDIGLKMTGACKSFRISKNPPIIPNKKCRFS